MSHVPNIDVNVCMCVIFSKRIYIWYISMWIYIQIYIYMLSINTMFAEHMELEIVHSNWKCQNKLNL